MAEVYVPYDVVVVGSGGGGLRAAISAAEGGARTLILAKGKINRSGSTLLAGANLSADIACDGASLYEMGLSEWNKDDTKDKFFADVCHEGFYLGNQKLVRKFVDGAPDRIRELMSWGMEVLGTEGERGISVFGSAILDALFKRVKELGIEWAENQLFTDVVVEDGAVRGCMCVDLLSGNVRYVPAKAVIIATGGSHGVFRNTSGPTDCCGEGPAAALRAGAELIDMEMISYCPAVILSPTMYKGNILPYIMNTIGYGTFVNKFGKPFTQRYLSPDVERLALDTEWNKMLLSYALQKEINSRGCNRFGGVYYKLDLEPRELKEELYNDLPSLSKGMYHDIMEIFHDGGSAVLCAPLDAKAGGRAGKGGHPAIFKSRADPRYQTVLKAVQKAKNFVDSKNPRYDSPNYKPRGAYLRAMKRYGIIGGENSENFSAFECDKKYWDAAINRPFKLPEPLNENEKP